MQPATANIHHSTGFLDVLEVVVPYVDQVTALAVRLTCKHAAAVACAAVQDLQAVLGTLQKQHQAPAGQQDLNTTSIYCEDGFGTQYSTSAGFTSAVAAFKHASSCRLYCLLRRAADPARAMSVVRSLHQHVPNLRTLLLLEVKGNGYVSPGIPGAGVNAVVASLPVLRHTLQDLYIKSLNPASSSAFVLPGLTALTALSLDCVMGVKQTDLAAVAQLSQLRQLMIKVDVREPRQVTTAGLEVMSSLQQLTALEVSLVAYQQRPPQYISFGWPDELTALQQLRSLTFSGDSCMIGGLGQAAAQLHTLLLMSNVLLKPEMREARRPGHHMNEGSGSGTDSDTVQLVVSFSCPEMASQLINMRKLQWLTAEMFDPTTTCTAAAATASCADAAAAAATAQPMLPSLQDLTAVALPPPGVLCPAAFTSFSQIVPSNAADALLATALDDTASWGCATQRLQQASTLTNLHRLSCTAPWIVLWQVLPHWQHLTQLRVSLTPDMNDRLQRPLQQQHDSDWECSDGSCTPEDSSRQGAGSPADTDTEEPAELASEKIQQPLLDALQSLCLDFSSASRQLQHLAIKVPPLMLQQQQTVGHQAAMSRLPPPSKVFSGTFVVTGLAVQHLTYLSLSGGHLCLSSNLSNDDSANSTQECSAMHNNNVIRLSLPCLRHLHYTSPTIAIHLSYASTPHSIRHHLQQLHHLQQQRQEQRCISQTTGSATYMQQLRFESMPHEMLHFPALQVLEYDNVRVTDGLLSSIAHHCPRIHTLALECRGSSYIEWGVSPQGLQHLSSLSLLRTVLLLSTANQEQYWNSVHSQTASTDLPAAALLTGTGASRQQMQEAAVPAQTEAEPAATVQAATGPSTEPTCTVDGNTLAASLKHLQFLHHLKIGVPFEPAASVVQLSALRRLQLLDLRCLEFDQQLTSQLESLLPSSCRLLCKEGAEPGM